MGLVAIGVVPFTPAPPFVLTNVEETVGTEDGVEFFELGWKEGDVVGEVAAEAVGDGVEDAKLWVKDEAGARIKLPSISEMAERLKFLPVIEAS